MPFSEAGMLKKIRVSTGITWNYITLLWAHGIAYLCISHLVPISTRYCNCHFLHDFVLRSNCNCPDPINCRKANWRHLKENWGNSLKQRDLIVFYWILYGLTDLVISISIFVAQFNVNWQQSLGNIQCYIHPGFSCPVGKPSWELNKKKFPG